MTSLRRRPARTVALLATLALLLTGPDAGAKIFRTAVKKLCTDTALRIPDGPEAGDFVSAIVSTGNTKTDCPSGLLCGYGGIPYGARVLDVDAKVRVAHRSVSDLDLLLVSPTGTLTTLTARGVVSGADFGRGPTDCRADFTVFDDAARLSLEGGEALAPFEARFRPLQALSAHDRTFGAGDWRFYFDDVAAGRSGVVQAIGLRLKYRYAVIRRGKHR